MRKKYNTYDLDSLISVKNQRINLGRFDTLEDAIAAKHKAQNEYYKEFSYLNSIKQSERIGE